MIKLKVPAVKEESINNCAIGCLKMVMKYYGYDLTAEEVEKRVTRGETGIYETEVGKYVRLWNKLFEVDCFGYNLYLFDPKDSKLMSWQLADKLQKGIQHPWFDKNSYGKIADSILDAVNEGVNYILEPPDFNTIEIYLKDDVPVIVSVSSVVLNNTQGDPYTGHAIVLTGFNNKVVYYNDPEDGKKKTISKDKLMLALYARKFTAIGAWLTAIKSPQ